MHYRTITLFCVAPTLLAQIQETFAQAPPEPKQAAASSQPGTDDLLTEIRLLRRQMEAERQRHEEQLNAMQKQLDVLQRRAGADTTPDENSPPQDGTAPGESLPGTSESGSAEASSENAEDELAGMLSTAAAPAPTGESKTAAPLSLQGAVQSFNPDISVNADFLAAFSTHHGGEIENEFLLREVEIGLSGAVDPYTSANAIVTIGREDDEFKAELEEAYLTYLGLPYGLQAKFGQYRAEFGKVNSTHRHAIPWVDYPFVIKRFFGEEGLSGTGAELSWLVPNPWNQYALLTYEVINNDNDSLFAGEKSDDFAHIFHLKTFHDLSPESTLETGASFATAPNDAGHGTNRSMAEGLDLTYRWKPKGEGLYRSFLWQSEVLFSQADIIGGQESTWGVYSGMDYQFAREWKIGARYDLTQIPFESSLHEHGYSVYLTFLQSEFVFWRLGGMITKRDFEVDGDKDDEQIFLQLNWTFGSHPAHKY